ncbi:ACT domain-containing protein [Mangrovibacterium diazotrophicum]|uniref:aspartate kinase n=1 Tax=Mangrovibacterium diazotrophicum TaxID=1261403 RepID=A0A419VYS8_9BACT|nr:ACT domain-containing protein [Mangrovibacterium diazotrophicum]RKD88393.1 aspartate kinase [Mangrovibacterium diazotrophicum]
MSECIVRFSGNNLKEPLVLNSLVKLLDQANSKHVLVISSPREIQSLLALGIKTLSSPGGKPELLIAQIKAEINAIKAIYKLGPSAQLKSQMEKLEILLKGIHYTGDFSPALQDQVLTFAEKISAILVAEILLSHQIESQTIFPEDLGLIVTEEFGNATVSISETAAKVKAAEFGKITLIPGSYGVTKGGKIARIGDRAADYTAATLASIFDASHLELWQIGTPFKTADEKYVDNPSYIESLTYAEASELSYFNYSGIHPRIVEPLVDKHIPILVYELKDGEKILHTRINSKSIIAPQVVKSVAHTDDIAVLKLNGPGVGFKPGILAKVTGAFNKNHINIRSVITAQTSINIMIDKASTAQVRQLTQELNLPSVSQVEIEDKVSLIAIVGHGMQQNHGISASLFTAVAKNKINVLLSGSGASDLVSYLVVDEQDKAKAIQEIHKIFFTKTDA